MSLKKRVSAKDKELKNMTNALYHVYVREIGEIIDEASKQAVSFVALHLSSINKEVFGYPTLAKIKPHLRSGLTDIFSNAADRINGLWSNKLKRITLINRLGTAYLGKISQPPWKPIRINLDGFSMDERFDPGKGHVHYAFSNLVDNMMKQLQRAALNGESPLQAIRRVKQMFNFRTKQNIREDAASYFDYSPPIDETMGPVNISGGFFTPDDIAKLYEDVIVANTWQHRQYSPYFTDEIRANNRALSQLEQFLAESAIHVTSDAQLKAGTDLENVDDFQWFVSRPGVCDCCDSRDGLTMSEIKDQIKDQFGSAPPPIHPNCLLGDAVISASGVSKYFKRWFDGEVITIDIPGYDKITVTPNHQILTGRGWVEASKLNLSDYVVCSLSDDRIVNILNPNNNQIKIAIKDFLSSIKMPRQMTSTSMPVSSEHFHGDGVINTEVEIVNIEGSLPDNRNIFLFEGVKEGLFGLWHWFEGFFSNLCSKNLFIMRYLFSANCIVCGGSIQQSLFGRLLTLPNIHRFASISHLKTTAFKGTSYGDTVNSDHPAYINTRLAGHIKLVKISDLTISQFSGHVYNLQTYDNYYIANGLLVHNCRCSLAPIMNEKFKDKDLTDQGVSWDPDTGELTIPEDVKTKYRTDLSLTDFIKQLKSGEYYGNQY